MSLFIKDNDTSNEGVQFLAGQESEELAGNFFTFSTLLEESDGSLKPVNMFEWGYTFNVEEARQIHKLLGDALAIEDSIE